MLCRGAFGRGTSRGISVTIGDDGEKDQGGYQIPSNSWDTDSTTGVSETTALGGLQNAHSSAFLYGNADGKGCSIEDIYIAHGGVQTNDARYIRQARVNGKFYNFSNSEAIGTFYVWKSARDSSTAHAIEPVSHWSELLSEQRGGSDPPVFSDLGEVPEEVLGWDRDFTIVKKQQFRLEAGGSFNINIRRWIKRVDPPNVLGWNIDSTAANFRTALKGYTFGFMWIVNGELGANDTTYTQVGTTKVRTAIIWQYEVDSIPIDNVYRGVYGITNSVSEPFATANKIIDKDGDITTAQVL